MHHASHFLRMNIECGFLCCTTPSSGNFWAITTESKHLGISINRVFSMRVAPFPKQAKGNDYLFLSYGDIMEPGNLHNKNMIWNCISFAILVGRWWSFNKVM